MAEMFSTLGTWNWLIFGFILMALELLAPGVFMFWLGLAALLVGLLSFAINPSWQTQLLMFAVFAVAAVPAWRHFARSASSRSVSNPFLNRRTEALVGREFTLEKPIVDGSGTVRIDDYDLARRRPRCAGRQPRQGRAGRWREPDGGGGLLVRLTFRLLPLARAKRMQRQRSVSAAVTLPSAGQAIAVAWQRVRSRPASRSSTAGSASPSARRRRRRCAARARSASPRAAPR